MSNRLKARTARASLFLVKENLRDLRHYSKNLDADNVDRLVRTAELTSTTIKKLLAWLSEAPDTGNAPPEPADEIDAGAVLRFLDALDAGTVCPSCGGVRHG